MSSLDDIAKHINKKYTRIIDSLHNPSLNEVVSISTSMIRDIIHLMTNKFDLIPVVGFSGGKESTVLLHLVVRLMKSMGNPDKLKVIYIEISGNTHEENIQYVYSIIKKLGISQDNFVHLKSSLDFYKAIKKWGFPSFKRRWCMNVFKRMVLIKYIKSLNKKIIMFVGDRFSDSVRRRTLLSKKGILEYNRSWNQYTSHPIAHWSLNHVFSYLILNNIELNPLYYKIGSSGNCVYCPFVTDIEYYRRLRKYYPEWYKKILQAEQSMKNKGGALFVANRAVSYTHLTLPTN